MPGEDPGNNHRRAQANLSLSDLWIAFIIPLETAVGKIYVRRLTVGTHLSRPFLALKQTRLKANLYNLRIKGRSRQRADIVKHLFLRPGEAIRAVG